MAFSFKERQYPCNEEKLVYTSYDNAVKFSCNRSDLRETVNVSVACYLHESHLRKYFLEFGAWHAMEVHPKLNGFPGYDCVNFKVIAE